MSHRFFRYYTFVGHYLLLYGRTNNVVKRRAALCFAACQSKKVLPAWFASFDADIRIVRRRHPHRSTQTSVSVDADIRIVRRRHPHRSAQTSASVGADVLIGGYGIPAIPTQSANYMAACGWRRVAAWGWLRADGVGWLRGYGRDAIPSY